MSLLDSSSVAPFQPITVPVDPNAGMVAAAMQPPLQVQPAPDPQAGIAAMLATPDQQLHQYVKGHAALTALRLLGATLSDAGAGFGGQQGTAVANTTNDLYAKAAQPLQLMQQKARIAGLMQAYATASPQMKSLILTDPESAMKVLTANQTLQPLSVNQTLGNANGNAAAPVPSVTPYEAGPLGITNKANGGFQGITQATPVPLTSGLYPVTPGVAGAPGAPAAGGAAPSVPQPAIPTPQQIAPTNVPNIASAIIAQESGGNPNIRPSVNGAVGIGQIKPSTFALFARPGESITNPADNLAVSGRIIGHYQQLFGNDPARVATAYFSGPGNVAPAGSPTPWRRNIKDGNGTSVADYVGGILGRMGGAGSAGTVGAPGTPDAAAAPGAAPAAAAPAPGGIIGAPLVAPHANVDVSPADAIHLGLAPGRWQRDPTGKLVQPSSPPADDLKRLADFSTGLDTLHMLANNQQKFLSLNANEPDTGLKYMDIGAHGHDLNPLTAYDIANNPNVSQMHALGQSQVLMVKPQNAGARILQSELPLWQQAVQGIDQSPAVNAGRYADTQRQITYLGAKQAFYNNWIYQHGNLNGADPVFNNWAAQHFDGQGNYQRGLSPEDAAKLPPGTPFVTLDGRPLVRR